MGQTINNNRILYVEDAAKYSREDMGDLLKEIVFIEGINFQCKTLDCQM